MRNCNLDYSRYYTSIHYIVHKPTDPDTDTTQNTTCHRI